MRMIILPRPCKAKTMKIVILGKVNEIKYFAKNNSPFKIPNFCFINTIIVTQV